MTYEKSPRRRLHQHPARMAQEICREVRNLLHAADAGVTETKHTVQRYGNKTARTVAMREARSDQHDGARRIFANNRVGGWRKLEART